MGSHDIILNVKERGAAAASGTFGKLTKIVGGLAAAYIGLRTAVRAFGFLRDSIDLWRAQANAVEGLRALVGDAVVEFEKYATAIQRVTLLGDEEVLSYIQMASAMGVATDKLKEVTDAAIGLSGALGIDVRTAMRYTILAFQGQTTFLGRYLPQLRGVKDATEAMSIVNAAAARGWTLVRKQADLDWWTRFKNVFGDLREQLASGYGEKVNALAESLTKLALRPETIRAVEAMGRAIGDMLPSLNAIRFGGVGGAIADELQQAAADYSEASKKLEALREELRTSHEGGRSRLAIRADIEALEPEVDRLFDKAKGLKAEWSAWRLSPDFKGEFATIRENAEATWNAVKGIVNAIGWTVGKVQTAGAYYGEKYGNWEQSERQQNAADLQWQQNKVNEALSRQNAAMMQYTNTVAEGLDTVTDGLEQANARIEAGLSGGSH